MFIIYLKIIFITRIRNFSTQQWVFVICCSLSYLIQCLVCGQLYIEFLQFQTFMSATSSPPCSHGNQAGTGPVTEVFSDPVQIAGFTGKSSLKIKLKQEEGVSGPKVWTLAGVGSPYVSHLSCTFQNYLPCVLHREAYGRKFI